MSFVSLGDSRPGPAEPAPERDRPAAGEQGARAPPGGVPANCRGAQELLRVDGAPHVRQGVVCQGDGQGVYHHLGAAGIQIGSCPNRFFGGGLTGSVHLR